MAGRTAPIASPSSGTLALVVPVLALALAAGIASAVPVCAAPVRDGDCGQRWVRMPVTTGTPQPLGGGLSLRGEAASAAGAGTWLEDVPVGWAPTAAAGGSPEPPCEEDGGVSEVVRVRADAGACPPGCSPALGRGRAAGVLVAVWVCCAARDESRLASPAASCCGPAVGGGVEEPPRTTPAPSRSSSARVVASITLLTSFGRCGGGGAPRPARASAPPRRQGSRWRR